MRGQFTPTILRGMRANGAPLWRAASLMKASFAFAVPMATIDGTG